MTTETKIDVTNPDFKIWGDYTNAEKAAHYTALDAGGRVEVSYCGEWRVAEVDEPAAGRAYRVIPAPVKTSRTYEMQLAAWTHKGAIPMLSSGHMSEGWHQGTLTVDLEDGKPVRTVWEATS